MIKRLIGALFFVLISGSAWAQNVPVYEIGTVTPGHAACFAQNGVVQDCGTAANGFLNALGITATGLPFCINDGPISSPYHQLCFGSNVLNGGAEISYNAYGGAATLPLTWNINGSTSIFNTSPGTVSSVALSAPSIFSVTGSPIVASGTLALGLVSQSASTVLAAPNGSPGVPSFRQLAAGDITGLAASATTDTTVATNISAGTLPAARMPNPGASTLGGIESITCGASTFVSAISTAGVPTCTTVTGTNGGTVTSIGLTMPALFSVSGSPVTTSGTIAVTVANQSANQFLAGPSSGSPAASAFRTIVGADLPVPSASSLGGVESGAASASQVMTGISTAGVPQFGAVPAGALPAGAACNSSQATFGNATTSAAVAVFCSFTPNRSGNIMLGWSGYGSNSSPGVIHAEIAYGTSAVILGGACNGTGGAILTQTEQRNANTGNAPFGGAWMQTGLTIGTLYYAQLCLWETGGGTATLVSPDVSVMEQ